MIKPKSSCPGRIFFVTFLIGLALSACSPQSKLKGLPSVKYFEPEIQRFDSLNKAEDYDTKSILFAGSSSIRLWKTIKEDMSPYPVIQRGFGGAKIEDLAFYLKRIVYPHHFRAIVFFCGTNNITGSPNDMSADSIVYWIKNINHQVRYLFPNVPIFWIAITPVNSRISVMDRVFAMNDRIEAICRENKNMYFIDTGKSYLDSAGKPRGELFISDQLHMNRDGYILWSSLIKQSLDTHLSK